MSFLFYINDLPANLSSTVRISADDTLLYLTVHSQADADTLQRDLHKVEEWEKKIIIIIIIILLIIMIIIIVIMMMMMMIKALLRYIHRMALHPNKLS